MLKIALGQIEVKAGHPDANTAVMLQMIEEAREQNADIIVFPEMAVPGYLLGDTWEQEDFLADCAYYGNKIIAASNDICVMFGNIAADPTKKNNDGRIRKYNAFFTAYEGKLITAAGAPYPFIIKTLLPNYREFDDARHFYSLQKVALELDQNIDKLLQPLSITRHGRTFKIGCLLCEDAWSDDYEVSPMKTLCQQGNIDLFVNISSSPYTLGKNDKRCRLFSQQAQTHETPIIYLNHTGIQNNGKTIYTYDGRSTVYGSNGAIIATAPAFAESLYLVDLSLHADKIAPITLSLEQDVAAIYEALSYGVKKFLAAIGMTKVVIGSSGGIDSAVAAALYADVLGPENILLVNMPSKYNSDTTKNLAALLAKNLQCKYTVFPIQDSVDFTIRQIQTTPIQDLSNQTQHHLQVSSFVAENIQARDRSSRILAGIAASWGGGFTCNANKSETTVGYSTLYGDQSGFLAALADLWKYQVYDLANYLNKSVYKREVIPQATIDIVPSAELSANQAVDEGKGDPIKYPYHDYLFRAFMERWNKCTPADILTWYSEGYLEEKIGCSAGLVKKFFPTPAEFIADLERWWNLYSGIAVAKRIQAPPILAISRRAYGFDHRESQNGVYYTAKYQKLKKALLNEVNTTK